ncbi:MAG: LysM peptidoglycan-binding domain-containing protein, partial [Gammaproteobacteria bacterium]|nr:LysM peptidoglycan-binding domain-containing protein [Gammaproteobacteria bacterium]
LTLKFKDELLSEIDTSGLGNLPPLTPEEQALEDKRIEQESATAPSSNNTDEKAQVEATIKAKKEEEKRLAQEARIAKEKAKAETAAKAKKKEEKRLAQEARIAKEKNELMRYKIKKGDTLSAIAKKYHTSIVNIKTINELINDRIRADDYLFVPFSRKVEGERIAKEKAEADRLAKEKAEADRLAKEKEEADRLAKEKAEADRLAKEKAEADRLAKEKAEAEEKRILEETIIAAQKEEEKRLAEEAKKPWYQFW